jgi:hypothetical protein
VTPAAVPGRWMRCGQCGFTQRERDACERCGAPLVVAPLAPRKPWNPRVAPPLQSIWLSPRETVRTLVAGDPTRGVIVLAWTVGLAWFLSAMAAKADDRFPLAFAIPLAIVVGPLLNFGLIFVAALLTTGTGRVLGGVGKAVELRAALAWAQAPMLLFLALWLVPAFGPHRWRFPASLVELGVLLWSEAVAVVLVAEVHRFSIFRSIVAIFLAWAIKLALIVGLLVAVVPDKKPTPAASPAANAPRTELQRGASE